MRGDIPAMFDYWRVPPSMTLDKGAGLWLSLGGIGIRTGWELLAPAEATSRERAR